MACWLSGLPPTTTAGLMSMLKAGAKVEIYKHRSEARSTFQRGANQCRRINGKGETLSFVLGSLLMQLLPQPCNDCSVFMCQPTISDPVCDNFAIISIGVAPSRNLVQSKINPHSWPLSLTGCRKITPMEQSSVIFVSIGSEHVCEKLHTKPLPPFHLRIARFQALSNHF